MTELPRPEPENDPFHLYRFLEAQLDDYFTALAEIRAGQKESHWMWYIFPQFRGLGHSPTSQHFAIQSLAEAQAYFAHPVLGTRLLECFESLLELENRTARQMFGPIDSLKLRSCATLFARACPQNRIFQRVLDRYYEGQPDPKTLELISQT
ncbi:MAG: DUF1810 domain-containing protein [Gemmataceae bacterium]|jgi:uncharacterized protein (DUF1810 family)|nr:DUF1810 domain-containing protein [Gemmataceae bacterium]